MSVQDSGRVLRILWAGLREYSAYRQFVRLTPKLKLKLKNQHIPQRFVSALLRLGPTFIKIGQILSTRPDILPPEYVQALAVLQERVPHFAFDDVASIVRETFGQDINQVFQSFEEHPVASASLAQVHFAVLPDGTEVAIKIQRPHIREIVNQDMAMLAWMLHMLHRLFPKRVERLNLVNGFNEFRRYTLNELDFSLEGKTLEKFRENFRAWDDIIFPTVYWKYTAPKILTMSRVSGLRLSEVLDSFSVTERKKLNQRIIEMEMKMFISDGFFHADLHPGNIFFQPDGKIVVLDAGMYGELTDSQRDRFMLYMLGVAQKQTRRAFYHLIRQSQRLSWADEEAFYRQFKALADKFYSSTLLEMSFARVYLNFFLIGARCGFVFPSDLLLHAKAITTAEALAFTMVPDLNFVDVIKPIIAREFFQRAFDFPRLQRKVQQILPELLLMGELPPQEVQEDYHEEVSANFLWTTGIKVLSTKLNEFEQSAGLMKAVVNPYVRKILADQYTDTQVDEILDRTWLRYLDLEPSIPPQKTYGARFTVHAAAAIIAIHEVLTALGQTKENATDLIYQIAWEVYTVMGDLPWFVGGAFTQDGFQRLKLATDAFRTLPFGSPAYLWQDVDAGEGVVGFDCLRCPVAEYFESHNQSELCVQTFCKLDFPLAEQWGATLERTGTIASGAPRCDFRWRHMSRNKSPLHP
ncbi:MAG: L-2-amino-thiazoline-4-carboxylic acid hydrolase [Anaerolineae bacterium]|nr:L-2-amino-thiazoline-4-carboxylic acid hydrolase [Anaerolineae bacterium]